MAQSKGFRSSDMKRLREKLGRPTIRGGSPNCQTASPMPGDSDDRSIRGVTGAVGTDGKATAIILPA
jgi:hypothetical protein